MDLRKYFSSYIIERELDIFYVSQESGTRFKNENAEKHFDFKR